MGVSAGLDGVLRMDAEPDRKRFQWQLRFRHAEDSDLPRPAHERVSGQGELLDWTLDRTSPESLSDDKPGSRFLRPFINQRCRRDIFDRHSSAVEDDYLVVAQPSGREAANDLIE